MPWSSRGTLSQMVSLTLVLIVLGGASVRAQSTSGVPAAGSGPGAGSGLAITLQLAPQISIAAGGEAPVGLRIDSEAQLPAQTFIRLRGLPSGARLSVGHQVTAGTWAVPLSGLGQLAVALDAASRGRAEVTAALVTLDGAVLAEARTVLTVGETTPPFPAMASALAGPKPAPPSPAAPLTSPTPPPPVPVPAQRTPQPPSPATAAPPPAAPAPAAAREPLAAPEPRPITPADAQRARQLLARGEQAQSQGDISAARNFYRSAYDLGLAAAALALGATYDPRELQKQGSVGVRGDPAEAKQWYERAKSLGSPDAESRLSRLAVP